MTKIILAFAMCSSLCLSLAMAQTETTPETGSANPSKIEGTKADDGQPDKTLLKEPIQTTSTSELKKKDKARMKHTHQMDPSKKMSKPHTEIKTDE